VNRHVVSGPPLVESLEVLRQLTERLAGERRLAFDTESASFHRYVDRVYLIQVSTDTMTAIVDPLAVDDLSPLGELLADPETEIVFHDADYDLRTLDRDYGFRARHIFDTRIAAQLAGEPAVGLGYLLEKYFAVRLNKKHQRADWSRRPVPEEMLAYAMDDTRYLLALRDRLEERLEQLGRLAWAREEFRLLEDLRWTGPSAEEEQPFLRMKGAKALRGRPLAVLEQLFNWRDETARQLDRAPFRVLGNAALLDIARSLPRSMPQLLKVKDLPDKLARRHGQDLLNAVQRGLELPEDQIPRIPRTKRPEPDPAYDARLERLKELRNSRAEVVGLDPGLVCPNATLGAIARTVPTGPADLEQVEDLRKWQREVLGDREIVEAVRRET